MHTVFSNKIANQIHFPFFKFYHLRLTQSHTHAHLWITFQNKILAHISKWKNDRKFNQNPANQSQLKVPGVGYLHFGCRLAHWRQLTDDEFGALTIFYIAKIHRKNIKIGSPKQKQKSTHSHTHTNYKCHMYVRKVSNRRVWLVHLQNEEEKNGKPIDTRLGFVYFLF